MVSLCASVFCLRLQSNVADGDSYLLSTVTHFTVPFAETLSYVIRQIKFVSTVTKQISLPLALNYCILAFSTHTHTHIYICICLYIILCLCIHICICRGACISYRVCHKSANLQVLLFYIYPATATSVDCSSCRWPRSAETRIRVA